MEKVEGVTTLDSVRLTLAVLLAHGLAVLHPAAAAGRAGGPVAQAPQELPAGADVHRRQRELVEDASVALIAAHNRLGRERGEASLSSNPYQPKVNLRIAIWNAGWAEVL